MCEFCEPTKSEKEAFYNWSNCNPYEDEEQTTDWEGIDFILDSGQFIISCNFDSGYIGDSIKITFNYCPKCGCKLS